MFATHVSVGKDLIRPIQLSRTLFTIAVVLLDGQDAAGRQKINV